MATGVLFLTPTPAPYGVVPTRESLETTGLAVVQPEVAPGDFTQNLPIAANPLELDGMILNTYADDFYDRIFLIPAIINVGGSTSTQVREFIIWSAYRVPTTLTAINLTDFDGMSIADLAPLDTFSPLQFRTARLLINPVGPREIDGFAEFEFDIGPGGRLTVLGSRGELAVFQPSWASALVETIEYQTTVSTSLTNREQRMSERYEPRITVAYPLMSPETRSARLREFLRSKGHERTATVLWSHYIRVNATEANETLIETDYIPSWVQPGIVIAAFDPALSKHDSPILGQIASLNRDLGQITLDSGLPFDLPAGTKLVRYVSAWFAQGQTLNFRTKTKVDAGISYLLDPLGFVFANFATVPVDTFQGRPLFLTPHNWANSLSVSYSRDEDVLDYGHGVIQKVPNADFTTETFQLDFLRANYERANEVRDAFVRARGRAGEFWRPSFTDDLVVQVAPIIGATGLTLEGSITGENYENDVTKRALEITLTDGTIRYYTLASVTPDLNNDTTDVVLEQAWVDGGGASVISKCRWLYLCRFASDTMTVEWLTDEVAQIRISIQTLPVEPAE